MKLLRLEHDELGIWYFTDVTKAANYTGLSEFEIFALLDGEIYDCYGWTCEEVDDDYVIRRFIDPVKD